MTPLVRMENVSMTYHVDKIPVAALRDVSLDVNPREFLALTGPSGSGKTTILNLIGCLEIPTGGRLLWNGAELSSMTDDHLSRFRGSTVGFVFQNFNLLPALTAYENIELPLLSRKEAPAQRRAKVEATLEKVGLAQHRRHRPAELSGGQRQRVAIARAIIAEPSLVLADEPTANLDHETGSQILDLMKSLNQNQGTTFVFSTHDAKVKDRASRVVSLWDGRVVPA